ncbi:unnamed protein product, partial [Symbiodinium necroappetens]
DGWVDSLPPSIRHFNVRLHDLRELNDPHEGAFGTCTGRHTGILEGILNSRSGRHLLTLCFVDIEKAVEGHKQTIILPFCMSNRHRSVAMGTLISAGLYVRGMDHFVGHLHANESWADMKCGGKCARCRGHFDDAEATALGNRALAQLDPQMARKRSSTPNKQPREGEILELKDRNAALELRSVTTGFKNSRRSTESWPVYPREITVCKMGVRSVTPIRKGGAPGSSGDGDYSTSFGDGHDTTEAIEEETLSVVPGIDDNPDDATSWAAGLSFPDMMDLARGHQKGPQ